MSQYDFFISSMALGRDDHFEITKPTFDELVQFREAVAALSEIEQSYSIAAQSYVEFEKNVT